MGSTKSIREHLEVRVKSAIRDHPGDEEAERYGSPPLHEYIVIEVFRALGQLDPDADPELIAWHLKANADEIERLREALKTVAVAVNNMLKVDEWSGFCGWCEAAMSDHDGDCQMATLYELDALREVTP